MEKRPHSALISLLARAWHRSPVTHEGLGASGNALGEIASVEPDEALLRIHSSAEGLTGDEAGTRLRSVGPNEIAPPTRHTIVGEVFSRSINPLNPGLDYSLSDRDIRHKFNFFAYMELPWKLQFAPRIQARTAQPATPATASGGFELVGGKTNRNTLRKDNEYFAFDWRLSRPFNITETIELIPQIEMFNTFNNKNLINLSSVPGNQSSLNAPSLFDFNGYLRQGVGDPREVQLSLRFRF